MSSPELCRDVREPDPRVPGGPVLRRDPLAESITDLFFSLDAGLRVTYWNKACEEATGVPAAQAVGAPCAEPFGDPLGAEIARACRQALADGKAVSLDIEFKRSLKLRHLELAVYPTGQGLSLLARDITERKLTEDALRRSKEQIFLLNRDLRRRVEELRSLIDVMPVGVAISQTPDCTRITANRWATEFLSAPGDANLSSDAPSTERLPTKSCVDGRELTPEEMPIQQAISRNASVLGFEHDLVSPGGERRTIRVNAAPLRDETGRPRGAVAAFLDVSESRRAQEALRQSEERYRALVELAPDAIVVHQEGRYVYANPAAVALFGASSPDELVGRTVLDLLHPKDREAVAARMARADVPKGACTTGTRSILRLDGRPVDVEVRSCRILHEGRPAVQVVLRDVTERHRAQEALRQSEERYRALVELAPDAIVVHQDGRYVYANTAAARLFGAASSEELLGRSLQELVHPDYRDRVADRVRKIYQYDSTASLGDQRILRLDGKPVDVETVGCRILHQDRPAVQVILRDVTERRQSQEALRRSELRFRSLFNEMSEGFAIHEIVCDAAGAPSDYRFLDVNPAFERLTGLRRADVVGRLHSEVLPDDDRAWIKQYGSVALNGSPLHFQLRSEGLGKHFEVFAYCNAPGQFATLLLDVTERKEMEEAVRSSFARYRGLYESIPGGVIVQDSRGAVVESNAAACEILGLTPEQLRSGPPPADLGLVVREDGSTLDAEDYPSLQALRTGQPVRNAILGLRRSEGLRWILANAQPILDPETGRVRLVMSTFLDVTERRRMEEALQESERHAHAQFAEIQAIYDSARVGLAVLDRDLRFVRINHKLAEINGLPVADHIGKTVREVTPGVAEVAEGLAERIFKTGEPVLNVEITGETPAQPGVRRTWVEQWLPLKDASGEVTGINVTAIEITERKRAEEELRKAKDDLELRVRERTSQLRGLASELTLAEQRERRRLAQVLHDHIQQLLAGVRLRVPILAQAKNEGVRRAAAEVDKLISDAIDASRTLTAELSPPILHESGLAAALGWLARWMEEKHGLSVEVHAGDEVVLDQEDVAVLLFQSARELLFNVVKHAGVRKARVDMLVRDDRVSIVISDDGVGFDPSRVDPEKRSSGGFGLFSIRERLGLMGGSMEVESAPGRGSRFTLSAPLQKAAPAEPPPDSRPYRGVERRGGSRGPAQGAGQRRDSGRVRVLLADDHAVMLQGLATFLKSNADIEVVGTASDGRAAVSMARRLAPDVVVMDISMPRMNGIAATRIIASEMPRVRVIGLSMFEEQELAVKMREAGATAYMAKSGDPSTLLSAIRACRPDPVESPRAAKPRRSPAKPAAARSSKKSR